MKTAVEYGRPGGKMRRFIEGVEFSPGEISEKSSGEKGPGRPPYWEMVFYWTRKPLIGARAVIAASLLPESIDSVEFKRLIRLDEKTPHRQNPLILPEWKDYFEGKKLLDPFAGFGSIPLEGLRLGLDVTAIEFLPTTYIFLKAILEYPKKFGKSLIKDVERWGSWITEQLRSDPDIKELYDEDVAVYIGTWEIKCPHCGGWTPAIGNYWLARVKDSNNYKRLAYMVPKKSSDEVEIKVIDLNEVFGDVSKAKVDTKKGNIVFEGEEFVERAEKAAKEGKLKEKDFRIESNKVILRVLPANIESRKSQLTCLSCGNVIKYADEEGRHYTGRRKGTNEFYVKFALRKYHEGDDRFARQKLLVKVKVKDRDLIFEPASREDNERLIRAKEKVKELLERNDPDVPSELIPFYEARSIWIVAYGFHKWFQLFNPRQLLTLIKIVRLIREAGKRIEKEKLKEGWNEERAFEYAEVVATYLSMAMLKYLDYNSMTTRWNSSLIMANTLSNRGIATTWNFFEVPCFARWTGSWRQGVEHTLPRALNYLTTALAPPQRSLVGEGSVKVIQGDATSLNLGEKFDIIVTDPPYADDVPYTELSDFYYVWLKRALSDSDGKKLIPRFHRSAFFKKIGPKWIEIKTQWQEFAKKEVSTNPGRFMDDDNRKEKAVQHFENLFAQAFVAMHEHLKDGGLLVTYYAHTSPESWVGLLNAGWKRAGLKITRAVPLSTESKTSIVSRGKMSLDTSVVAVWRKEREGGMAHIERIRDRLRERAMESAKDFIRHGYKGLNLLYGVMASVLKVITSYDEVRSVKGELSTMDILEKYAYPDTITGIIWAISEIEGLGGKVESSKAVFYTAYKVLFGSAALTANDLVLLNLATLASAKELEKERVVKAAGGRKEYTLFSPDLLRDLNAREMGKFLAERGLNPLEPNPRSSVDVLHLLEYYSLLGRERLKEGIENMRLQHSFEVNEALTMAGLIAGYYKKVYSEDPRVKKRGMTIDEALRKDEQFDVILMKRLGGAL